MLVGLDSVLCRGGGLIVARRSRVVPLAPRIGEIPLDIRRFSTCGPQRTPGGGPGEPGESLRGARGVIFGFRQAFGSNFLHCFAFLRAKFENQLGKKGVVR